VIRYFIEVVSLTNFMQNISSTADSVPVSYVPNFWAPKGPFTAKNKTVV
jgi:hypothetical protein